MKLRALTVGVLVLSVSFAIAHAGAQEVVHALSGTVNNVNPKDKTITVITDDGSEGFFKDLNDPKTSLAFNKKVRAETVAPGTFDKKGDRIIMFYLGFGEDRTAVAVRDLGPGPFNRADGTIVKLDRAAHSVTIKTAAGDAETFRLDPSTVAESDNGPVTGDKFEARAGEKVRVVANAGGGDKTALFIIQLSL